MCPSLGLQLCMFTAFVASFALWQGSQYPTLLPTIKPEEFSSSSKIEQEILVFKHLYFVMLKHELHMSPSLELFTESFARQASRLFFLQHCSTHSLR